MKNIVETLKSSSAWATVIVTAISPFGQNIYDAIAVGDIQFVYSYKYEKNPVLEWNRQISVALTRLDDSIKDASDLPRSILKALTGELIANAPALAAYADLRPFDSVRVDIFNVSSYDLKDIRVIFHGCSGYDSHRTFPDTLASPQDPVNLRTLPEPTTISYRKLIRESATTYHNATIYYYGADTSRCKPEVFADLDTGRSATGARVDIDDFIAEKRESRQWWTRAFDISFRLGIVGMILVVYFRLRAKISRIRADA